MKVNTLLNTLNESKYNVHFYGLILLAICSNFILFFYLTGYLFPLSVWVSRFSPFFTLASAVIISLPYFLLGRDKHKIFYLLLLLNVFFMSTIIYYKMYSRIIPLSSFSQVSHLDVMMGSVVSLLEWTDYVFLVPTFVIIVAYYGFFNKKMIEYALSFRLKIFAALLFCSLFLTSLDFVRYYRHHGNFFGGLTNIFSIDPMSGVAKYGFIVAYLSQAYQDIQTVELSDAEQSKIKSWVAEHQQDIDASRYAGATRKNVILIIVESLESWVINHKIDKQEITPNINKLLENHTSIYAPRVVPQVREGRSSDAQLIIQTGLLPIVQGAACMKFSYNKYPSLPFALKEKSYNSYTFMGNQANFWNQNQMNKAMGFDGLISIQDYEINDYIGFGLSDSTFFGQSVAKVQNLSEPFFLQMITLTSHHPYNNIPQEKLNLSVPSDCDDMLSNYMKAVNYTDRAIGLFISQLKEKGLFDKSMIVITGDHEAFPEKKYKQYSQEKYVKNVIKTDFFVPLIVINAPQEMLHNEVIGQIDIYPTLLDLLDVRQYPWRGMGQSMFAANRNNYALNSHKYQIVGDTAGVSKEKMTHQKAAWEISDLIIRGDFFQTKKPK